MKRSVTVMLSREQRRRQRKMEKLMRRRGIPWAVLKMKLPTVTDLEDRVPWTSWVCLQ